MYKSLDPILQALFLVTLGAFVLLCLYKWTGPEAYRTEPQAFCGTESPAALYDAELHPNLELGKSIFRNNCAACHAGDMKTNLTGPALGGMVERWEEHGGLEALYAWIRNSQQMIAQGENARALELWEEWSPTVMNSFQNLTDEDLDALTSYIETGYHSRYMEISLDAVAP